MLVGAGYALVRGTSVRGLVQGVVLQHLGFDQVYFRWPGFGIGDVLLSLGVGLLVWAATGPAIRYWRSVPWVPAALEFGVTPMLVLIALLADPWSSPKLDWVKPVFIWALPLVAATRSSLRADNRNGLGHGASPVRALTGCPDRVVGLSGVGLAGRVVAVPPVPDRHCRVGGCMAFRRMVYPSAVLLGRTGPGIGNCQL